MAAKPSADIVPVVEEGRNCWRIARANRVSVVVDEELMKYDSVNCHPLVNTATLVLSKSELERFFTLTGHAPKFFRKKIIKVKQAAGQIEALNGNGESARGSPNQ